MAKKHSKKDLARLHQKLASHERSRRELQESLDLLEKIGEWARASDDEQKAGYKVVMAHVARVRRIGKENGIELDPEYLVGLEEISKDAKALDHVRAMFDRAVLLNSKQALRKHIEEEHSTPKPKMCVRCDSREAHFGDVCKHCAEELGIRPTGKV